MNLANLLAPRAAFFGVLLLLTLACGCQAAPALEQKPSPVPAVASAAIESRLLPATEIQKASDLYKTKCARCHKLYDPARYSETKWNSWMKKMSRKARLKPEQEKLLVDFLRSEPGPGAKK